MKKKILIPFLVLVFIQFSYSQGYGTKFLKSYGIIFGYQGFQKNLIEIGVVKGSDGEILTNGLSEKNHLKIKRPYMGLYGSIHYDPFENIKGLIIGFTGSGGGVIGLDFNYYKYEREFFGLRLSYGLSILGFETIYRYNFKLSGKKVPGISGHLFSIRYYLPFFVNTENGFIFNTKRRVRP